MAKRAAHLLYDPVLVLITNITLHWGYANTLLDNCLLGLRNDLRNDPTGVVDRPPSGRDQILCELIFVANYK